MLESETTNTKRADELATACVSAWNTLEKALLENKRRYPSAEFDKMFTAFEAYIAERKGKQYIHRDVAQFVNIAFEYLSSERTRIPDHVLKHSQRMSYMLFDDFDPLQTMEDCDDD